MNMRSQTFYDLKYENQEIKIKALDKYYIKSILSKCNLHPGSRILDLGCGTGSHCEILRSMGMNPIGLDFSEIGIRRANKVYKGDWTIGDGYHLPFRHSIFDAVLCSGFSGFNNNLQNKHLLNEIFRVLSKGGIIIIAYNSDLSGEIKNGWMNYKIQDVEKALSPLGAIIYITNKILCSFNIWPAYQLFNIFSSKIRIPNIIICFIKK